MNFVWFAHNICYFKKNSNKNERYPCANAPNKDKTKNTNKKAKKQKKHIPTNQTYTTLTRSRITVTVLASDIEAVCNGVCV